MKSVAELGILVGVAVVAGLGNWLASGMPSANPAEEFDKAPLEEGEILLADVLELGGEGVVWVDARPEPEWRENGLEGSINITLHSGESLDAQLFRNSEALLAASRVVIYCSDILCTSSHDLAVRLKGDMGDFVAGEVFVLRGGVEALKAGGLVEGP